MAQPLTLDRHVQDNLIAAVRTYRRRFGELSASVDLDAMRERASGLRDRATREIDALWERAHHRLSHAGVQVHFAVDDAEARALLVELVGDQQPIVKSKSNLLEELGVHELLAQPPTETDAGDWIVQRMGVPREHPNAPAAALSAEQIASFLRERGELGADGSPEAIVRSISVRIREEILRARVGLTGVNLVTSEGHLVIIENEGNISLVTRVPPVHVAVVARHRIAETLEDAVFLSRCLAMWGTGHHSTAYVNVIAGPSCTADIEKSLVLGAQGAQEVHLIVVDNGRSDMLADDRLRKALKCIGCGACLLHCPVFEVCGARFGGTHAGGIGLVLSRHACGDRIDASNGTFACLGCELCEEICPVDAKIWDNIKTLRSEHPSKASDGVIDSLQRTGTLVPRREG